MKLSNKFYGSTAALIIGWLMLLLVLANIGKGGQSEYVEGSDAFVAGLGIVCGATAYRVLKRRMLKIGEYDTWEFFKEYMSLIILGVILLGGIVISVQLYPEALRNPNGFFVIPFWSLIAYCLVRFKGKI